MPAFRIFRCALAFQPLPVQNYILKSPKPFSEFERIRHGIPIGKPLQDFTQCLPGSDFVVRLQSVFAVRFADHLSHGDGIVFAAAEYRF